jgi:hypothetical protein
MDPVVILSSTTVSVGPGQEARLPVRVRNQSRRVESYRVEVVGAPASFSRVDPSTVSVLPGREAEIDVWFNPPAGASTPTGSLPFAVRATSEVDAASAAAAEGLVELAGVAGLQAWFATTARSARWKTSYDMEFANQGNAAVRLAVMAHDPSGALNVTVSDDVVDLPPGGRTTSKVSAKARQPFLRGTPANRIIQARCQSFPFGADRPEPGSAPPLDDPNHRTFQLTLEQKPILSKLVVLLAVLALGAIAAFVVLKLRGSDEIALGLASPEAPPTFTAETEGSTSIFLEWAEVPNAVGYNVRETTEAGEAIGTVLDELEPDTLTYSVTGLDPGSRHCYSVVAVGPEEAGNSRPSEHQCATTTAASQLAAPAELVVEPRGTGKFGLTWRYPRNAPQDVEFRYLVNNQEQPNPVESPTEIQLIPEAAPYIATISVRAVRGEEKSDPSNSVEVTVPALPATTVTTTAGTAPTTEGGGVPPPPPPTGGGTPTTATPTTTESGTTTPTTAPPTTAPPSAAQDVLRDLEGTWAVIYEPVVLPPPAGSGVDVVRANLATALGVAPREIRAFSPRDTITSDATGQLSIEFEASPDATWLYRPAVDEATAVDMCSSSPVVCRPLFVEGAAKAAARTGASIVVLQTFAADTPLSELDSALEAKRTELDRETIFLVAGADYGNLDPSQIVMYASGLATASDITNLCTAIAPDPCTPVVLAPSAGG